uniref:Uncharacterized protein n=1 Tax=Anguilla anguilla TaxID=7936 RepID=A0A0E9TSQ1_ANGAN
MFTLLILNCCVIRYEQVIRAATV